uniref:Secreted protein n=1 Tax=Panagrolaimus sp. JU765 TaxID=591449 RepID=A0AC34QAA7_9BILA
MTCCLVFSAIFVVLIGISAAEINGIDGIHPMVRYRFQRELSPFTGLYLRQTAKRIRTEQFAGSSRNCFFSPIQCRLPVAEITPQTIENPLAERLRKRISTFQLKN